MDQNISLIYYIKRNVLLINISVPLIKSPMGLEDKTRNGVYVRFAYGNRTIRVVDWVLF